MVAEWGVRVKWLYGTVHLTRKNDTVVYCTDCITHADTDELHGNNRGGFLKMEHKGGSVNGNVHFRLHERRQYVLFSMWVY